MNFDFSDDQKALKDEARRFLTDKAGAKVTRRVLDDAQVSYDEGLWRAVAEMGWLGAAIPEEHGGLGLGRLELCALAEELGRAVAPIPFSSTVYFFAEALMLAGSDAQKAALLPKVAAGEVIGAFAVSEGPGALTAASIQARFDGSTLSGVKIPVTDGDCASHAVVVAKEGSGVSLVLVDLNQSGVTRTTLKTLDPSRGHAKLEFKNVKAERLGAAGQGWDLAEAVLDRAAVLIAFEQVGGSQACLEMALDYAKSRYAFSRQIGSFQAIKHKLADMYVSIEVARSNAYYGAWALSTEAAELPFAAAASRAAASDAYYLCSKENIQTHGGMGFTWDVDCHLFFRRAKLLAVQAGAPAVWKEKLVKRLEQRNAA
ncbi:acyl-CoA dehydrogenase family protein [Terricaulis silvestris]|uniref:Acyl-CoA dehydrogenase n=1 Tax=Terricaulis silvestris TaxID=2686094 RepID=A0A6I6MQ93_9CAUL|nr:acyl-CoA dehydrogenase family protein [Terricaulis silvestris]QGZ95566.1 Acyl-CoA dehydrogenase [Terricaulis silvestris]